MTTALNIALFLFDAGVGELTLVFDAAFVLAGLAETRFRTLGLRKVLLRMRSPGKLRVALICLTDQHQMRGDLLRGRSFVLLAPSTRLVAQSTRRLVGGRGLMVRGVGRLGRWWTSRGVSVRWVEGEIGGE